MEQKTLVVVGAGPGLGLAVARRFGREGYRIALIARREESLASLVEILGQGGVVARGYTGDVSDGDSLKLAFARIRDDLGIIDALEYSPLTRTMIPSSTVDTEAARVAFGGYFLGAVTCVQEVLPAMLAREKGMILLTVGRAAIYPMWQVGAAGPMAAALRTYALSLSDELAAKGVYVACGTLCVKVDEGWATKIADMYWQMQLERTAPEVVVEYA